MVKRESYHKRNINTAFNESIKAYRQIKDDTLRKTERQKFTALMQTLLPPADEDRKE
jgi:hypothetical protein